MGLDQRLFTFKCTYIPVLVQLVNKVIPFQPEASPVKICLFPNIALMLDIKLFLTSSQQPLETWLFF